MAKQSKSFTTSLTHKNIDRIEEVARKLFDMGKATFVNKAAAANELIRLGYHVWYRLNGEANPNVDSEILNETDNIVSELLNKAQLGVKTKGEVGKPAESV